MRGSVTLMRVRYSCANSTAVFSREMIDFRIVLIWEVGIDEDGVGGAAAASAVLLISLVVVMIGWWWGFGGKWVRG